MSDNDLQQLNNETEVAASPSKKKFNKIVDIVLWVLIAVLAVSLIARIFFVTQITVKGDSMLETLHDKQVVTVSKVKRPNRGDIVVFYEKDDGNKFTDLFASDKYVKLIKRVVAVAGDKLWLVAVDGESNKYKVVVESPSGETFYENGYEYDGETLAENGFYISGTLDGLGILVDHVGRDNALEIQDDHFFAMGDNRGNSLDSRAFGAVPKSRLYGVVIKV